MAIAVGALVALTIFGAIGGYFGLQTRAGGRLLRGLAVAQANKTIVGHLDVAEVEFGGTSLMLRDVVLSMPAGEPVATVGKMTIRYGWRGLLARRVDISDVELERPQLHVRQDAAGGTNLSRALTLRQPSPPHPEKPAAPPGKGWQLNLDRFHLADGSLEYSKPSISTDAGDAALLVRLAQLGIDATGHIQTTSQDGDIHLVLSGRVNGPAGMVIGPLAVNADFEQAHGEPRGKSSVTLGNLLAIDGTARSRRDGEVSVRTLRLPPALVLPFVPSYPIRIPLLLSGVAVLAEDVARVDLALRGEGASGALQVRGDVSLANRETPHGVHIEARGLNLAEFVGDRFPGTAPLVLSLAVEPGSLAPEELSASAKLAIPRTEVAAHGYGPLNLQAKVSRGALTALDLNLPLPGALLTATGAQRGGHTAINADLTAYRLATVRSALMALGVKGVPVLRGAGTVALGALGPHVLSATGPGTGNGWTMTASARVPSLSVAGRNLRGLAFDANLPEVTATRQSADLSLSLRSPMKVMLELSARATESTVGGGGAAQEARVVQRTEVSLDKLSLTYPGTRWSNQRPATLWLASVRDGSDASPANAPGNEMALRNLVLTAGPKALAQELAIDAQQNPNSISARVRVHGLRLQDLPLAAAGIRPSAPFAGLLDADVAANGAPASPRVDLKVALREGRFAKLGGLTADVLATLRENRTVHGTAHAGASRLGALSVRFDGPATATPPSSAPVAVTLDLEHVDIGQLPVPATAGIRADGTLDGHAEVRGTFGDPHLAVRVTGHRMTIDRTSDAHEAMQAKFDSIVIDGSYASPHLEASVNLVDGKQGTLRASASSTVPLAELRQRRGLVMVNREIRGSLRLHDLAPEPMRVFVPTLKLVEGQISGAFEVHGTIAQPQLAGQLTWRKGALVVAKQEAAPGQRTEGPR